MLEEAMQRETGGNCNMVKCKVVQDGLPTRRWSPIQVLTRQRMADSQTRSLMITSLMP